MAPQPYPTLSLSKAERQPTTPLITTSLQSNSSQTITNIVFGLCALFLSLVTVWQGRKAWIMWHARNAHPSQHASQQPANPTEVELGDAQVGSVEDPESNPDPELDEPRRSTALNAAATSEGDTADGGCA